MKRRTFIRKSAVVTTATLMVGLMDVKGDINASGTETGCKTTCKLTGVNATSKPVGGVPPANPSVAEDIGGGVVQATFISSGNPVTLKFTTCSPGNPPTIPAKNKCKIYMGINAEVDGPGGVVTTRLGQELYLTSVTTGSVCPAPAGPPEQDTFNVNPPAFNTITRDLPEGYVPGSAWAYLRIECPVA